jgi:hypothetical protein
MLNQPHFRFHRQRLHNHALNAREANRARFIVTANQLRNLAIKAIRDLFDRSNVAGVGLLQQLARNAAQRFVIIASCQPGVDWRPRP